MSIGFLNTLPPLFSLTLFGCAYFIYLYNYCLLAVKVVHNKIILIVLQNIISILLLWSFLATMLSSVGEVPREYKFTRNQHNSLLRAGTQDDRDDILEKFRGANHLLLYTCTATGSIRYCSSCMHIKPDRAHHCVTCAVCSLRMDHHCPWVNNCIGFANYKNFLLLIFYTFLFCLFFIVTTIRYVISTIDSTNIWDYIPIGIGFGLGVVVGLITGGFLCYHLYLVGINETTLENVHNPHFVEEELTFNLGVCQNYTAVFGHKWYLWIWPVFSSTECGYIFLVARK